jgi:hypothetical protein
LFIVWMVGRGGGRGKVLWKAKERMKGIEQDSLKIDWFARTCDTRKLFWKLSETVGKTVKTNRKTDGLQNKSSFWAFRYLFASKLHLISTSIPSHQFHLKDLSKTNC